MTKSGREIVEIFEAYDLTGTAWSAAQLTGCDAKTAARYVAIRADVAHRKLVAMGYQGSERSTRRAVA